MMLALRHAIGSSVLPGVGDQGGHEVAAGRLSQLGGHAGKLSAQPLGERLGARTQEWVVQLA